MSKNKIKNESMKSILLLILAIGVLPACSAEFGRNDGKNPEKEVFAGNTYNEVKRLDKYGHNHSQKCDKELKPKKLEITAQLEKRKKEIQKLEKIAIKNSTSFPLLQFGDIYIKDNRSTKLGANTWYEERVRDWDFVVSEYEKIKNTPTNGDWIRLDDLVRSLISDEEDRLFYVHNLSLKHHDRGQLLNLISAAESCLADENCKKLEVSASLSAWMSSKRYYEKDLINLNNSKTEKIFRKGLQSYVNYTNRNYRQHFEVRRHNHEVDVENSTIIVRMNMDVFGAGKFELAKLIEEAWSLGGLKVKLLTTKDPNYSFYKFAENPAWGRAQVSDGVVMFASGARLKTMFHEFGHILGLRDEYYTLWHEEICGYYQQLNDGNIMSNSRSGSVTQENIDNLKEVYFN